LEPVDYEDLGKNPDLAVIEGPGAYIRYICLNTTTDPYTDVKIREAVAAAIDRSKISDVVFMGTHGPLYSMVPMGMWSHIDAFKDEYGERDLEKAISLLEDAGYSVDNPLETDLWFTPDHYGPTEDDTKETKIVPKVNKLSEKKDKTLKTIKLSEKTDRVLKKEMPNRNIFCIFLLSKISVYFTALINICYMTLKM
ncbi:unnamed protein product, partial [marine sediment metagenome]